MKGRFTHLFLFLFLTMGTLLYGEESTNNQNFTIDCDAVSVTVNNNVITVTGLNAQQNTVQYLGEATNFQTVTACENGCASAVEISDLTPGHYEIKVQQSGGGYCFRSFPGIEVVANGGNNGGGNQCNVSAGSIATDGPTTICIDGVRTPLNFSVTPGGIGTNRGWIITDNNRNVLALPNAPPFDLEDAGPGTCRVYYIRYENDLQGLTAGQNLANLTGCFDLSNAIAIDRVTSGGPCENGGGNGVVNCDAVIASTNNGVITVSGLNAERNTIEVQGAGTGYVPRLICRDDCGSTIEIPGLPAGDYTVKIQQQDANDYCYAERNVTVGENNGGGCNVNAGSISTDGPTTICIDGVRTPLNFSVTPGGIGSNRGWIITDDQRNILALPSNPPFDLEDAGPGTCRVYYIRYENNIQGLIVGQNLVNLTGCFDLSNKISIDRVTSGGPCENGGGGNQCNVSAGSISTDGPTTICIDGIRTPLKFSVTPGGIGTNRGWIITDNNRNVLALPSNPPFDLEDAGSGTCRVYYIRYENDLQGLTAGQNLANLTGCFDLSNAIAIDRVTAGGPCENNGGGNGAVDCDGVTASSANGVITVSNLNATNNTVEILGAGTNFQVRPICRDNCGSTVEIPGLPAGAYTIKIQQQGQGDYCYTERTVTVGGNNGGGGNQCNASAGSISTDGPTTICLDGIRTPLNFSVTPGGIGSNRGWIISDDNRNILALPSNPPFDLEDAGPGTCRVYYIRYEDNIQGLAIGQNVANLTGCFDLSNAIAINRVTTGGPCENGGGGNGAVDCDAVAASAANGIITVTGLNAERNTVEVQGEGTGYNVRSICRDNCGSTVEIPGLPAGAYTVKIQQQGQGEYCYTERTVIVGSNGGGGNQCNASAGSISTDGPTSICLDGVRTPLNFTVTPGGIGSNRGWIITDDQRNILALPAAPPFDLEDAGVGTCRIYYIRYENNIQGLNVGQNLVNLSGCFDLSNAIEIVREEPDGGQVMTQDGQTEVTVCAGNAFVRVTRRTSALALSYWYIITDENDNILDFLNPGNASPNDDVTLDLSSAPPGQCKIWGWSYRGLGDPVRGQSIFTLTDDPCETISNNFVTVNRITGGQCDPNGGCDGRVTGVQLRRSSGGGHIDLTDGQLLTRSEIGFDGGFLRFNTAGTVGSVKIEIRGAVHQDRIENFSTFDSRSFHIENGTYNVRAQVYSEDDARGTLCSEFNISFTVIDNAPINFRADLGGSQEVCPKITPASGHIDAVLRGRRLTVTGSFDNLLGNFDRNIAGGAHVHKAIAGRNGDIELLLTTRLDSDQRGGHYRADENTFELTDDQVRAVLDRMFYVNIHTTTFASGELRGQLLPRADRFFQSNLLGINEVPANNSQATGNVLFELRGHQLIATGSFDDFTSDVATDLAGGGHIHRGFAGQNGDIELLFDITLDADNRGGRLLSANNTFTLTNEQRHTLIQQGFYLNFHSQANRPGEVRGQVAPLASTYFVANLEGGQEVPPINVNSDGSVHITFDGHRTIKLSGSFNNLEGDLNRELAGGVHLHLAPRGQNGDIIFLIETTTDDERNGTFLPEHNTFELSDSQIRALFQEGIYVNVHSLVNVPGELRGQVVGQTIDACGNPSPSSSRNAPMLDLAAFRAARQVDLQWLSNTGYKNDYFVIEKSIDGETFAPMQKLTNEDFSEEVAAFSITDETPETGMNYYKIKQVHVDGTFEYSEIRTVEFNIDLDKVGIYPNPAQETVSLNLTEYQGKSGKVTFYNQYGQLVKELEMETISASPIEVSLEEFTNGTYHLFIQLEGGRKPISKKLQVTKLY